MSHPLLRILPFDSHLFDSNSCGLQIFLYQHNKHALVILALLVQIGEFNKNLCFGSIKVSEYGTEFVSQSVNC